MTFSEPIRHVAVQEQGLENAELPDIDYHNIKKAAMVLRSLNHKLRQQVIKTIYENQRLTVTQLYVKLRLEQSVASQHLAILRKAGIVGTQRDGKFIYYSINSTRIESINDFVKKLIG
ncbi:MAG: metalloregulator ArsR/SmtB family transcription factor [Ginsengibacter sp.]